jgi:hypothetical protein
MCATEPKELGVRHEGSIARIPETALIPSIWSSLYFGQGAHRRCADMLASALERRHPASSCVAKPPRHPYALTVTEACTTMS